MTRELMPWAEDERADWDLRHGDRGCTCFVSPPCGSCLHPGNPVNLDCTDEAWGDHYEVLAAYADIELPQFIAELADRHLAEMLASWKASAA